MMKRTLLLSLNLFLATLAFAQTRVEGVVSDAESGETLIGVSVAVKGQALGAVTDINGQYTLSIPDAGAAILVFTYTGYSFREIALEGRSRLDVRLSQDVTMIEQVVVVGYGTQKKSDLTGAIGTIKGAEIERVATGSVSQALQGKLAGVYVSPASGEPGAAAIIRIRGTGTLNNSNPIFVVDGMITYDPSFINPQDVASLEVLKDASACAIYGARGANGVIIITTKSGRKSSKSVIGFSSYYGTQQITKKLDLMNAAEFAEVYNDLVNAPYYPNPAALGEGTDWQDEIFQSAPIGNIQLSASGGGERYSFNLSGNYFNQKGVLKNSEFNRYTLRLNNDFKVTNWLTIGNNLAYSNEQRDFAPGGVIGGAYRMPPVFAPYDSTGKFSDPTAPFGLAIANPAADLFYKSNAYERKDRFVGTFFGEINFLKYFRFRSNFGFDLGNSRYQSFEPIFQVSASQLNRDDKLFINIGQQRDWIWEQTVTYSREWDNHSLNVLAGYTSEERAFRGVSAGRRNFPGSSPEILYLDAGNDTTQTNSGGAHDEAMISYLFRTNYTFMQRYLLTVSMRVDQSSRFAAANRRGVFPSFSLGWNAGQEEFIENLGIFDRLKFRGSYGILGNQNSIRDRYYPSFGTVTTGLYSIFGVGENLNQGATLISLGNPSLRWETARQTDIGLEFGLFKGRLQAEIDWYNRFTYDIIAAVPIPDYVGSQDDPVVNTAKVRNRGWEFSLNWRQRIGTFSWNAGGNLSPVQNRVISLNDQKAEIFAAFLQGDPATRTAPGSPIGSFYGYQVAGVFQSEEELNSSPTLGNQSVGDLRFKDINGVDAQGELTGLPDGKITDADRTSLGSPIPKLTYGFNIGFDWLGFDFVADMFGVSGNKVFNAKQTFRFSVYNWEKRFYERWTPENPSTTNPRITNGGVNYRVSDYFIEDGSFIRLRNVVLGYSLPQNWLERVKITKFRVYISGTNLWTSQKYSGYSPEFGNDATPYEVGFDNIGYPVTKSYQMGLDVTF